MSQGSDEKPFENPLCATSLAGPPGKRLIFFYFRNEVVNQMPHGITAGLPLEVADELCKGLAVQILEGKGLIGKRDFTIIEGSEAGG